ncbi:hypothetical protein F383_04324 [Gossypium arboreum]|uniref:Uncharacterized protein n=1 Tax=Gossypium arboreum TaxID=29729 RepID=A0A0B0PUQ4_GOSAR|nr:hypothetical protein F383_04324 [Gossypium arboreum]
MSGKWKGQFGLRFLIAGQHTQAPHAPPYAVVRRLKTFAFPGETQVPARRLVIKRH